MNISSQLVQEPYKHKIIMTTITVNYIRNWVPNHKLFAKVSLNLQKHMAAR